MVFITKPNNEGEKKECDSCGMDLVARLTDYKGRFPDKLQWQSANERKAHYDKDGNCKNSETPQESATLQEKPKIDDKPLDELEKFALQENTIISKITKVVRIQLEKETDGTDPVRGDVVWVRTKEIYNQWRLKNA